MVQNTPATAWQILRCQGRIISKNESPDAKKKFLGALGKVKVGHIKGILKADVLLWLQLRCSKAKRHQWQGLRSALTVK